MCNVGDFREMQNVSKKNPLRVYRWFRITSKGKTVELCPLTSRAPKTWLSKVAVANAVPSGNNFSGLHAFFTKEEAISQGDGNDILGLVEVFGECAIHNDGVRAQFARIVCLYPSQENRFISVFGFNTRTRSGYNVLRLRKALSKNRILKNVPLTRLNASKIRTKLGL